MLEKLTAAWRLRRVLLIGRPDTQNLYMEALLHALSARPARIPPDANADTLCRAMRNGRISAVIVPSAHALAGDDLFSQLRTLDLILNEMREAGVPLAILCSHEDVYSPEPAPWQADEQTPLGGRTRAGLFQSILQLYANGVSRGLLGDPVAAILCRHTPCLGSDHPACVQYSAWCRALLCGEAPTVNQPHAQGTFFHPLDAALGALWLGAHHFADADDSHRIFNLGCSADNVCANRSACLHLMEEEGTARTIREAYPPCAAACTPLDGSLSRKLCGVKPLLNAHEALSCLMAYERALSVSESAADLLRRQQARSILQKLQ